MPGSSERERLRRRYRPADLRLLFIGEAPPASGRFFYNRDSGLYRAMQDAFCVIDPSITNESFLAVFQRAGCYLIDTCQHPIDRLDRQSRRAACVASEPLLSRRIRRLQPQAIVTLVRSIRNNVERATHRADWRGLARSAHGPSLPRTMDSSSQNLSGRACAATESPRRRRTSKDGVMGLILLYFPMAFHTSALVCGAAEACTLM
jgi:hypothetical protein